MEYTPRSLAQLAEVSKGLQRELLARRARRNPVGGESFIDRLGPERASAARRTEYFPTKNQAEPATYDQAFPFQVTKKKWIEPKGGRRSYQMDVNGGLIMSWGGPVMEKKVEYGPTITIQVQGVATKVSWAGKGWEMLKRLSMVDPPFSGAAEKGEPSPALTVQDLTPYRRSNQSGTGLWHMATRRIIDGKVRKDEVFVAGGGMRLIGNTLEKLVLYEIMNGKPVPPETLQQAKMNIANYLDMTLLSMFGTADVFDISQIDEDGIESIRKYAEESEQKSDKKLSLEELGGMGRFLSK